MKQSIWMQDVTLPEFEQLRGEKKTDVLVIGGGICGLLCAYFLKQAGIDSILVEGKRIASGITQNTTAKITSQHGLIYDTLIRDFGKEKAQMYLLANQTAVKTYKTLCQNIQCDFQELPSYTYSRTEREKIEREIKAVQSLGFPAEFSKTPDLPFATVGAVRFPEQAQFHPLKFIAEIVKGLKIYENTFIRDITPTAAISDTGKIIAKKIIVATHFPFINKHGSYFLKLYQHRSYVLALENAQTLDGMYVDENKTGMSFRMQNDFLLLGGGSHRTGKQGGTWTELENFAKKQYPQAKIRHQWATQDCMSLDSVPYIGRYSARTPDLYVATGFNKWGITSSMAAAMILCDMVREKENAFAEVFSPRRSILKPQLLFNGVETTMNLLTPTPKRCPHLGCALKWNKAEHTWDCPCHGSRFTESGRIIDNPATGDATIRK